MRMRLGYQARLAGIGLALLAAAGCESGYVAFESAPPPVRYEMVVGAPGPQYVWVSGYWNWGGGSYYWVPGRWAQPPSGRSIWLADRWEQRGHRWHRVRGHWR